MKLKYYLRGLGIGLIITTILLTISNSIKNSVLADDTSTTKETTGSVIAYTTQAATDSDTNNTSTAAETESTTASGTEQTTTSSANDETTTESSEGTTQSATQAINNGEVVTVTIQNAYYASIAADALYDAKVISDKSAFISYLNTSGYEKLVQDGEYEITAGDSYENIAKIISKLK